MLLPPDHLVETVLQCPPLLSSLPSTRAFSATDAGSAAPPPNNSDTIACTLSSSELEPVDSQLPPASHPVFPPLPSRFSGRTIDKNSEEGAIVSTSTSAASGNFVTNDWQRSMRDSLRSVACDDAGRTTEWEQKTKQQQRPDRTVPGGVRGRGCGPARLPSVQMHPGIQFGRDQTNKGQSTSTRVWPTWTADCPTSSRNDWILHPFPYS